MATSEAEQILMAYFIHWPSKRPIWLGEYEFKSSTTTIREEIGVGWCFEDLDIDLRDRDGVSKSKTGTAKLLWDKANRKGAAPEVPILVTNFSDGDVLHVVLKGTLASYSTPLRLRLKANAGRMRAREQIVEEAKRHFAEKAHYLWGTAGNIPGGEDSHVANKASSAKMILPGFAQPSMRITKKDDLLDPKQPLIGAAYSTFNGLNICGGRFKSYPDKSSIDLTSKEYLEYLDKLKSLEMPEWSKVTCVGEDNLTPRSWKFQGSTNSPVFAESCAGKRQIDCIGLVNFCVSKVWAKGSSNCAAEISAWMDEKVILDSNNQFAGYESANGNFGTMAVTDDSDIADGDLVGQFNGRWHHIGIIQYRNGGCFVVQASDTESGLTEVPYNPKSWARRTRILDQCLLD